MCMIFRIFELKLISECTHSHRYIFCEWHLPGFHALHARGAHRMIQHALFDRFGSQEVS